MKIAIASGKGGTGKTTLAVNLALRAAETMPVALLDLDVEEPNGGIFIQAEIVEQRTMHRLVPEWDETSCTLCGKCVDICRFNTILKLGKKIIVMPELCHSCHACSELCPRVRCRCGKRFWASFAIIGSASWISWKASSRSAWKWPRP